MEEQKVWKFWVEGEDEGSKLFMEDSEKFLTFLKDNDPCVCGAMELSPETVKKIEALGVDDTIPEEELI